MLESMIDARLLCDYIDSFFAEYNEAQAWDMWLHKETGKTWGDFKLLVIPQDDIPEEDLETANKLYERLCQRGY